MARYKDITGKKFGRLTAIKPVGKNNGGNYLWQCKCDCGAVKIAAAAKLLNGTTKSCGCYQQESRGQKTKIHGMYKTKIHKKWRGMKYRCYCTNGTRYKDYGGRGIEVAPEWLHDFKAFYDYVSKLPHYGEKGYSIDRIDNDGNYAPNNVRWATAKEQIHNRRTKKIDINIQISFLDE